MTRPYVSLVQVEQCSVRLLGQIDVRRRGFDSMVRWPFKALSISEPDLAGALIRLGQTKYPQQASHALITYTYTRNLCQTQRQHSRHCSMFNTVLF